MARIPLNEQVAALNAKLSETTADLRSATSVAASRASVIETLEQSAVGYRTQLDKSRAATDAAVAELAKLTENLKSVQQGYDYLSKVNERLEGELEQAHAVLDGVANCPGREYPSASGYGTTKRALSTRLAGAMLAIARGGSVVVEGPK